MYSRPLKFTENFTESFKWKTLFIKIDLARLVRINVINVAFNIYTPRRRWGGGGGGILVRD